MDRSKDYIFLYIISNETDNGGVNIKTKLWLKNIIRFKWIKSNWTFKIELKLMYITLYYWIDQQKMYLHGNQDLIIIDKSNWKFNKENETK